MRSTFAGFALVAIAAAKPVPQSDSSCSSDYSGSFKIQVVQPTSSKVKRQDTELTLTLSGGKLTDQNGRTGYLASNNQFQFDQPVQAGGYGINGFAVCGGFLAHDNGDTTWDSCKSGDFSNLYSSNSASYCKVVNIQVLGSSASAAAPSSAAATQISDGQPQAPTVAPPVTQITDGQPQAPTSIPAPVTQISDGQPQAPTSIAAPVTQISDGQPQAPTIAPVTQISDGQPQAPTVAPVTQISDGQPQVPTIAPVTQISDGQPQAPLPTGTGGLPYPGANTTVVGAAPSASVVPATGAASSFTIGSSIVGLVAAVAALAMF